MSGGSWDYIASRLNQGRGINADEMRRAAERLNRLNAPHAATAARAVAELVERAEMLFLHINGPLHDMEWIDSGDYGPDQMRDIPTLAPPPFMRERDEARAIANDKLQEHGATLRLLEWAKEMVERDHADALREDRRRAVTVRIHGSIAIPNGESSLHIGRHTISAGLVDASAFPEVLSSRWAAIRTAPDVRIAGCDCDFCL